MRRMNKPQKHVFCHSFNVLKGSYGFFNPQKPSVYLDLCGLHFFYSLFLISPCLLQ